MKSLFVLAALICIPAFGQAPAEGPEEDVLLGCYNIDEPTQSALSDIETHFNSNNVSGYAVYAAYAWKQDRLDVTFAPDTSKDVRERVAAIMVEWNSYSRVQFRATESPYGKGDIRVDFRPDSGNHSQLGRLARKLSTNSSTMNLATCAKWPVGSKQFKRVVLHEFGHALGFAHEHQHPIDDCSAEIDWEKAYTFFQNDQHWSHEMVDNNLRTIKKRDEMLLSPIGDLHSIMRYYLSPSFLKDGKRNRCFSETTYELSQGDKLGAERLYPKATGFSNSEPLRPLLKLRDDTTIAPTTKDMIGEWAAYWEVR